MPTPNDHAVLSQVGPREGRRRCYCRYLLPPACLWTFSLLTVADGRRSWGASARVLSSSLSHGPPRPDVRPRRGSSTAGRLSWINLPAVVSWWGHRLPQQPPVVPHNNDVGTE